MLKMPIQSDCSPDAIRRMYDATKAIVSKNVEMLKKNLLILGQQMARSIKSDVNQIKQTTSSGAKMVHKNVA